MMNSYRHITSLILLCFVLLFAGCTEDVVPGLSTEATEGAGDVTLTINVSIANSGTGSWTRAEDFGYETTKYPYELISTLRVIIVRDDNTVEWNRLVSAPGNVGLSRMGELEFKVSTSQGKVIDGKRTEKKRIYLIANEASIPANPDGLDVQKILSELKAGYYKKVEDSGSEEDTEGLTEEEKNDLDWALEWKRKIYVPGDPFTPKFAEGLIIYNEWPNGSNGANPYYAEPYINNEGGTDKKFVPMTEFFDIEVTSDMKSGVNIKKQEENLFITRNLVKFRFSIIANPEPTDIEKTTSFKVTAITFHSLKQEEYLFPNKAVYVPSKYEPAPDNERQITEFETPGFNGKYICPYVFKPQNFVYNGNGERAYYDPELYFCETQTLKKDEFTVGIDVEFPFFEEVKDADGNTVKDADGNPVTQRVTSHFEAKAPLNNLPYFIPRNTVVDIKMTLTNGELSAVATVLPYTAVSLNPEFGFSTPETDHLYVAPSLELPINGKATLQAKYTPDPTPPTEENPEVFKLIWVSSDPSIILLEPDGNDYDNPTDLRYVEPAETIELPYFNEDGTLPENGLSVPVRIVPQATGNAVVTVYSQTGLVARCEVTVTDQNP